MIKKIFLVLIILALATFFVSNKGVDMVQKYINSHQTAKWAPSLQFKLASLCLYTFRYEKSLISYQIIRKRYPTHSYADEALFRIARCYEELQDKKPAVEKYREFIYFYPNHPWASKAKNKVTELTFFK